MSNVIADMRAAMNATDVDEAYTRLLLNRFLAHVGHCDPNQGPAEIEDFFEALDNVTYMMVPQITRPRGYCNDTGVWFPAQARVIVWNKQYDVRLTWQQRGKEPPGLGSRQRKWRRTEACLLVESLRCGGITELVTGGQVGQKMIRDHFDVIRHATRIPWLEPEHLHTSVRRTLRDRTTLVVP
jgi:hypothetical protein